MSHTSSTRSGMLNRKLSEVFSLVCTYSVIQILQLQIVIAIFNLLSCENTLKVCVNSENQNPSRE